MSNNASIRCGQPALDALRTSDDQRPAAPRELRVEQEERQAAEMIAMKVSDQDEVDTFARDA